MNQLFSLHNIKGTFTARIDILNYDPRIKDIANLPSDAFHFRLKNRKEELRDSDEVQMQQELLRTFYPQATKATNIK